MTTPALLEILPIKNDSQLAQLAEFARGIWYDYYVPLIGRAQVDYMVAKFQSEAAIRGQLAEHYEYFVMKEGPRWLGYCAVQARPDQNCLFISKLYVHGDVRGRGTGHATLEFIERKARAGGLTVLALTVNRRIAAVSTYLRWGFRIVRPWVAEIGGGFVMDDFWMEKPVATADSTR